MVNLLKAVQVGIVSDNMYILGFFDLVTDEI